MVKTFLIIPTTFLTLWLSGLSGFNFPLTDLSKPTIEKSIAGKDVINSEYKVKTIVIDAGHGGRDGGCSGTGSSEKVINLKIAKKVKEKIENRFPEMRVIMTRDKDVFIPLHGRAKIANQNDADLFLSIHCNAIRNAGHIHGSESYVLGLHKAKRNLEVAKRENDVIFLEEDYEKNYGFDPNSAAGHIMISAFQNANLEQSILFAEKIETHIKLGTSHKSRGVKQAGFHVLREVSMPSVLLETGYLTSKKDQAFLIEEKGQNQIAQAIVDALSDYKNQVETGLSSNNYQVAESNQKKNKIQPSESLQTKRQFVVKSPQKEVGASVTPFNTAAPAKTTQSAIKTTTPKPAAKAKPKAVPITVKPKPAPKTNYIRVIREEPVAQMPQVEYRIQLAASRTPLTIKESKLKKAGLSVFSIKEAGINKYQAGNFSTFKESLPRLRRAKNSGFSDAFLVAYDRGQKISLHEARKLTGE